MKYALAIILLSFMYACNSAAVEDNVHFSGALVAEPCSLSNTNINLEFGTIIEKSLYLYQRTKSEQFKIELSNCDPEILSTVSVTFNGDADPELNNLLALDPSSAASGVAVGIELANGDLLPLNKPSPYINLENGGNILKFMAFLQITPSAEANKSLVAGDFKAISTFILSYK